MSVRNYILASIVALVAVGGTQNANAQGAFTLSSTGFKDGERLPSKFAGVIGAKK